VETFVEMAPPQVYLLHSTAQRSGYAGTFEIPLKCDQPATA